MFLLLLVLALLGTTLYFAFIRLPAAYLYANGTIRSISGMLEKKARILWLPSAYLFVRVLLLTRVALKPSKQWFS